MEYSFAIVITNSNGAIEAVIPTNHPRHKDDILEKWIEKYDPDYFQDTEEGVRGHFTYAATHVSLTFEHQL